MSITRSRREFLRTAAGAGLAAWAAPGAFADPAPDARPVRFACIGVGGKGEYDTADAARLGQVVAICDVDDNTLHDAAGKYPNARPYNDYRVMLREIGSQIDAVTVSTPDHHHAPAAAMAMRRGKHCFCQKPLTHSLYEARQLARLARRMRVATEMGNQGTADNDMRHNAALVRAGVLGAVSEVHVWTNRPIWPQGQDRPAPKTPPSNLHWDLWLGPRPVRPYGDGYAPFSWRGWWDFGTGALGDMGCRTVNLPFMALDLRDPVTVLTHTSGSNHDSYPKASTIRYQFAANANRPAVTMFWYDGGNLPSQDLVPGEKYSDSGSLIIGEKGKLYTPGDYGGGGHFIGVTADMPVTFPQSPGHFEEFIRAIRGGAPAMSNFPNYAVPLTETILLGNLAVWVDGKEVQWDARNLRALNAPEVHRLIHPSFQHGYHV